MASLPFLIPAFFIAGAACALGPVIIHLLNRRRFREVNWAAMDFLREAVQRNRRIMEIRDIVLLILRTAAILLIGAAVAQPFIPEGSTVAWQAVLLLGVGAGLCIIVAAALWSDQWIRLLAAAGAILLGSLAGFLVWIQSNQAPTGPEVASTTQPVHAILGIDNSLSMAYQTPAGTLLDEAKTRAKDLVGRLPVGSRVSVLPLCGSSRGFSLDPYRTPGDANQAIDSITVVDRSTDLRASVNLAKKAMEASPDLGKRIILIGDQQLANWRGVLQPEDLASEPPMQIVTVAPDSPENSWVADFRLEDGLADTENEAKLIVELRHAGETPRSDVQVKLTQLGHGEEEGEELATQTVTLQPATGDAGAGSRQLVFNHTFAAVQPEPGRPVYVPLRVSITGDQLPADDERYLVVPVVAALPVVFIDQYSDEDEQRDKNLHGETFALRRLLAPRLARDEVSRHLVRVVHVKPDQVDRSVLEDARLVVVAGLPDPAGMVPLLREYVLQGGQLVIAAGGQFAPERWQELAWLDGAGILPAPLSAELLGKTPEEAPDMLKPFQLAFASLQNQHLFKLAGVADNELSDLYSEPYFFKIAPPLVDAQANAALVAAEAKRLGEQARFLQDSRAKSAKWAENEAKGSLSEQDRAAREEDKRKREELDPAWLVWKSATSENPLLAAPEEEQARAKFLTNLAESALPQILARFDNETQTPYLVQRKIGAGRVLFAGSGIEKGNPTWTTLRETNAILLFDRILRGMIESTLTRRTHEGLDQMTIPLASFDPNVVYSLHRPIAPEERGLTKVSAETAGGEKAATDAELLDAGFIGPEQRGLTLHHLLARGVYRVVGERRDASAEMSMEGPVLDLQMAINGPAQESSLAYLTRAAFDERTVGSKLRWVEPDETISLEGGVQREQDLWWYAALAVLAALLVEMTILAWPTPGEPVSGMAANENEAALARVV